ncbi:MAG TPA: nucleotidyltransferase family protein [Thermoanaerobaculia bacterium]
MDFQLPPSLWPALNRIAGNAQWPPGDQAGVSRFMQCAAAEGLIPLLLTDGDAPQMILEAANRFKAIDAAGQLRVRVFEQALRATLDANEGERIAVMKGADYTYRLYPSPHLRPQQDIDVLVAFERAEEIAMRMRAAGYRRQFPSGPVGRLRSYHEAVFTVGSAIVEVHHSFVQRVRHSVDYDGVWTRAIKLERFGRTLYRLDDVDAIVCHAISMNTDQFATAMFRYIDLWLMLRGNDAILPAAVSRARQWAASRALFGALRQTSRYFPEFSTPAVERAMADLLSPRPRAFVDRKVLPDPWAARGLHGRRGQLWKKLWLIDTWSRRLRFAAYHVYAIIAGRLLAVRDPT